MSNKCNPYAIRAINAINTPSNAHEASPRKESTQSLCQENNQHNSCAKKIFNTIPIPRNHSTQSPYIKKAFGTIHMPRKHSTQSLCQENIQHNFYAKGTFSTISMPREHSTQFSQCQENIQHNLYAKKTFNTIPLCQESIQHNPYAK